MKNSKETLRYKHMVARLQSLPVYKKEAALMQEIAKGRQWRIDAAMEAVDGEKYGWNTGALKSVNAGNVLKQAAVFGRLETMEKLCKKFKFEVPEEDKGMICHEPVVTAFHVACLHGHTRVADYLAKACGASAEYQSKDWVPSRVFFALDEGDVRKLDYLLKKGADGGDMLRHAISTQEADMGIIRHLVEDKKVDVNAAAEGFWTPFLQAVKYGHNDIAHYLLEHGATPQKDKSAGEAMYTAAYANNVDMIRTMIGLGMKPDQRDLTQALFGKAHDAARVIIAEGGVDINSNNHGALVYAIRSLTPEAVKFCLDNGADVAGTLADVKANTQWARNEEPAWKDMIAKLEALSPKPPAQSVSKPPQP